MELAQLHTFADVDAAALLRELLPPAVLHRRATLGLARREWRPADVWEGAIERLAFTWQLEEPAAPTLSDEGVELLGRGGIARRHAPVHAAEVLVRRIGDGLVTIHSDAGQLSYVAVYRERRLAMSLMKHGRRLVRCDGHVVMVDDPVKRFPEQDGVGVLIAGMAQWLREPLELSPEERMLFPDCLAALTSESPVDWRIENGDWLGEREGMRGSG
ncbi:MAG: hypothetical protein ACOZNI_34600 [Myxococcota bacterium]